MDVKQEGIREAGREGPAPVRYIKLTKQEGHYAKMALNAMVGYGIKTGISAHHASRL